MNTLRMLGSRGLKVTLLAIFYIMSSGFIQAAEPYDLAQESYQTDTIWRASYAPGRNPAGLQIRPWNTPITTYKENSYVVYLDPFLRPKIVKITPFGSEEVYLDAPDYATYQDTHHAFSIGVDESGYIHLTGDMHNYPSSASHMPDRYQGGTCMYWRSDKPEDISSFTWLGKDPGGLQGHGPSYAAFFNDHEGRLFWAARCKTKTKNSITMSRFNTDTQTWTEFGGPDSVSTVPSLMRENEAQTGSYVLTRMVMGGATDAENRVHVVANLLNETDLTGATGYVTSDTVYLQTSDFGNTFTKANGSVVPLPARVEAGVNQGDVIVSHKWLNADTSVAVDRNNNPCAVIRTKESTSYIMSWNSVSQTWMKHDVAYKSDHIVNGPMGVMMIPSGGNLQRFWDWSSAHRSTGINVGGAYTGRMDKRYIQTSGNVQALKEGGDGVLEVSRTIITRPASPEIEVEGGGLSIEKDANPVLTANDTDFGLVAMGNSSTKTYTVRNTGTIDLRLFTVETRGAGFSVVSQPTTKTLAPGASTTFDIQFTQGSTGATLGQVTFGNNDPDESRFTFAVRAHGGTDNLQPVAMPDTFMIANNEVLQVEALGLLSNDYDLDGDSITAVKKSDPQNGILILNGDGSFTYTPDRTFSGTDQFTYAVNDGSMDSPVATVKIEVTFVDPKSPFPPGSGGGKINGDRFNYISGTKITDLTSLSVYPNSPTYKHELTSFNPGFTVQSELGLRIYGYIHPPETADYTFWISGKNECALWVSTDHSPANLQKIAYTPESGTSVGQWSANNGTVHLVAGETYYIEVLRKSGSSSGHLNVGWETPNHSLVDIAKEYLSLEGSLLKLSGNGNPILYKAWPVAAPQVANRTDFGSVSAGQSKSMTYTITNKGGEDLVLTGSPAIQTASTTSGFSVTAQPTLTTIPAGQSTTFTVTFLPNSSLRKAERINIASNDPITSTVGFNVVGNNNQEISVLGNGIEIISGGRSASTSSGTDFGNVAMGQSVTNVFTIKNTGSSDLTINSYIKIMPWFQEYRSIGSLDKTVLASGESTSLKIAFTPRITDAVLGEVTITSDDSDENPYVLYLTGRGSSPATVDIDYDRWMGAYTTLSGNDLARTADPDQDGVSNLIEYALGMNPSVSDREGLPQATTFANGCEYTFNMTRDPLVNYQVEVSNDLINWRTFSHQTVNRKGSASIPFGEMNNTKKMFIRLQIFD